MASVTGWSSGSPRTAHGSGWSGAPAPFAPCSQASPRPRFCASCMKISRAMTSSLIWFSISGDGAARAFHLLFQGFDTFAGNGLAIDDGEVLCGNGKAIVPSTAAATRPDKSDFFIGDPQGENKSAGHRTRSFLE